MLDFFADFLNPKGLLCTIRESKTLDIEVACRQLRESLASSIYYNLKKTKIF
ncbi:ribosomal RNA large subunit methyltransferase N [Helicobacter cetorum MIT 99-5656]|uniref:Ribosomal RNA large subunit methyltransferase N n=1 Tax=Helicobacter cetorum (strain ATCC BAA-540 / CCUG 52418 / MIT 99-5656) TaxID=1163745 RepID=I0EQG4_HELCM|nr:ribosomal RNA large subunit methyltransferase N [Helicobacter cetorum MIT 99-5656]